MSHQYFAAPLAEKLRTRTFASRWFKDKCAFYLERYAQSLDDQRNEVAILEGTIGKLREERNDLRQDVEEYRSLSGRIDMALAEMATDKRTSSGRREKAHAILLSPYQYQLLSCGRAFRPGKAGDRPGEYRVFHRNIPVYVAAGVYGPLVVTEDAYNALARQAPELNIRAAN